VSMSMNWNVFLLFVIRVTGKKSGRGLGKLFVAVNMLNWHISSKYNLAFWVKCVVSL